MGEYVCVFVCVCVCVNKKTKMYVSGFAQHANLTLAIDVQIQLLSL